MNEIRKGELFLLGYLPIFGFFPIITTFMTKIMPPVLFGALSLVLGSLVLLLYLCITKSFQNLFIETRKGIGLILGTTVFNIIVPFLFVFIGASLTSGINTALLSQTELLFTFLICGIFFHELITLQKVSGALLILIGTCAVLYNGTFTLNGGDILIIIAQLCYPFGNRFSKKALATIAPQTLLFARNAIGGAALLGISAVFETWGVSAVKTSMVTIILLIFINGVFIHGISKLLWFEGLKRLDITKAISIIIATPAFSFAYALFFLKEVPTVYQVIGLFVILAGLFVLTRPRVSGNVIVLKGSP